MVHVEIGGKTYSWGKLDERKCTAVYQAGTREISPFLPDDAADTIDKVLAEDPGAQENMQSYSGNLWGYLKENVPYIKNCWESFHHPAALCGARGCIRACMAHLEKKDVLGNKFKEAFRPAKQEVISDQ